MQLNESTVKVLQNFANINPNMVFTDGNVLKTMSEARNIVSEARIDQEFPRKFGIYDLNEFLGALSLFDNPMLTFSGDEYVLISDVNNLSKVKYFFSDPEILTTPTNTVKMPSAEIQFKLTEANITRLKKAASSLGHSQLKITPHETVGNLDITVFAENNPTANTFNITVPGNLETSTAPANFEMIFNVNNLKFISGDYDVSISSKNVSNFKLSDGSIEYWVALEKESRWS